MCLTSAKTKIAYEKHFRCYVDPVALLGYLLIQKDYRQERPWLEKSKFWGIVSYPG
jgi:hypothetical protein